MKLEKKMMNKQNRWLDLAQELQFLAQGGLAYTKDKFDQERFEILVVLFLKVIRFCWCRNLMDAGQFPVVG